MEKNIEKRQLVKLLKSLSYLELKRFNRFLESSYHNTNQQVKDLLDWVRKHKLDFTSPKLTDRQIFNQLFSKKTFSEAKLQTVISNLSRLAEDFLIQEHLRANQEERKRALIQVLRTRNYHLFKMESLKLAQHIEAQTNYKTEKDYATLHELHHQLWYHEETQKYAQQQEILVQSQNYLDQYYQLKKWQYLVALTIRAKVFKTENDREITTLKKQLEVEASKYDAEYLLLYKKLLDLYESDSSEYYFDFKALLEEIFPLVSKTHQQNFLVYLVNFIINYRLTRTELGEKEIFELYKLGVREALFIQHGRMRDVEFANICLAGFRLGKNDWTLQFMEDHQGYLPVKTKAFLIPFVKAYYHFFLGEYEKVIDLLRNVQPEHQLMYLFRIKSLLIRAYFECVRLGIGHYQRSLPYELASFKKLMERNQKQQKRMTQAYLNFMEIIRQLIPLFNKPDVEASYLHHLSQKVEHLQPLLFKAWLIEKIKDFQGLPPTDGDKP